MDKITAFAMGFAFRLGQIAYAVRHGMAMDDDKWITIHPNGKGVNEEGEKITGRKVLINEETGMVRAGFGTGKHISQIGNKNKPAAPATSNANNASNTSLQKEIASLQKQKAALQDDLKKAQADLSDQHTAALQQQLNNALEQAGSTPLNTGENLSELLDLPTPKYAVIPGETPVKKVGNICCNDEYHVITSSVFGEPAEGEFYLYNKGRPALRYEVDHAKNKHYVSIPKNASQYQRAEVKNLEDVHDIGNYSLNGVAEYKTRSKTTAQFVVLKNKTNGEFMAVRLAVIHPDGKVLSDDKYGVMLDNFGIDTGSSYDSLNTWQQETKTTEKKSVKKTLSKKDSTPAVGNYDFSAVWTNKLVKQNANDWTKFINATDTDRIAHVQDMMDESQKQRLQNATPEQRQDVLNQIYEEIGNRAPKLTHSQLKNMSLSDFKKNFLDNVRYFGDPKRAYYPVNPSLNTGIPLQFVQQQLGNNIAPALVDKAEYNAMKSDTKNFITIHRGVIPIASMSAEELQRNLREGKQTWLGDGIYGDGLYFSNQRSTCSGYAYSDKDIQEGLLDKSKAKIIDYKDLYLQATPEEREFLRSIPNNGDKRKKGNWSLLALKKGYNVIKAPQGNGVVFYIPLDRSALVFEK